MQTHLKLQVCYLVHDSQKEFPYLPQTLGTIDYELTTTLIPNRVQARDVVLIWQDDPDQGELKLIVEEVSQVYHSFRLAPSTFKEKEVRFEASMYVQEQYVVCQPYIRSIRAMPEVGEQVTEAIEAFEKQTLRGWRRVDERIRPPA
jgi:hypothetical protein